MVKKILLLINHYEEGWVKIVERAAKSLDMILTILPLNKVNTFSQWTEIALVLMEKDSNDGTAEAINIIQNKDPNARIIVFSATPGWKEAIDIMLAKAIYYARKPVIYEDLLYILKKNLDKRPYRQNKI